MMTPMYIKNNQGGMKRGYRKAVGNRRPKLWIATLALLLVLSCRGPEPHRGGTVVIGLSGDIDSLNELTAADSDALQIIKDMLFMSLTRLDENLQFTPYLATSWEFSDDHQAITFHLREDINWSDGAKTTAEDIIFTYKTMINPAIAYPAASRFELIKSVEKIDDYTIQFNLVHPYPDVLFDLQFPILPQHILGALSADAILKSDFGRRPVSNGPFVLQSWQANQAIYFSANKQFAPGPPLIDQIIFSIIPEETMLAANLLTHDIDLIPRISHQWLKQFAADNSIRTKTFASNKFTFIGWNCTNPMLSKPMRTALSMAINKVEIINTLLQGYGKPALGPLTPMAWAFDSTLKDIDFNPQLAKKIFSEQGWKDSDGDGILDKNNQDLRYSIKVNSDSRQHQDVAVMVQAQLKKVGVEIAINRLDWNTFIDQVIYQKAFDAVVMKWEAGFTVNPTALWHSASVENGYNFVSYKNPRVDALLEQALRARDRAGARPLWREFQQTIIDDCPYTFLFIPDDIVAGSTRLTNAEFDIRGFLANVQSWQIAE